MSIAISNISTAENTIAAKSVKHCIEVVESGIALALLFELFKYVIPHTGIQEIVLSFEKLKEHLAHPPTFLINMVVFVAGFSLVVSREWGKVLRVHIVKPLIDLLVHSFGAMAGFLLVIGLFTLKPIQFSVFVGLDVILLGVVFLGAYSAQLCIKGMDGVFAEAEAKAAQYDNKSKVRKSKGNRKNQNESQLKGMNRKRQIMNFINVWIAPILGIILMITSLMEIYKW
ncbi:MAG: hypothetical protein ACXWJK_12105 [Burkholderiaceae bacterium]